MDPPEDGKKSLSFGFFRKQEVVQLAKSAVGDHEENEDSSKDFVLSLESNKLRSTKANRESKKQKDYVIPLINQNRWRIGTDNNDVKNDEDSLDLDQLAAKEILQDSARHNDEWDQKGSTDDTSRSIPLLMQNKIPDGFETDSKLDVELRPVEPNDADYDKIPIEHFGMAMLRGMGWNEDRGVGKDGKVVAPVEAQIRPKGLGLGADRSNRETKATDKGIEDKESSEPLDLKKGSFCVLTAGPNKDLYGTVEGIDEDNSRVMVKLALSGKTINLIQCNIQLVSKKEFEKFSKYLNKQKVDKYKEEEQEKRDHDKHSSNKNGYDDERPSHKRRHSDEEHYDFDDHSKNHKHLKKNHESSKDRHHKHSKHSSKSRLKSHKKERIDSRYDNGKESLSNDERKNSSDFSYRPQGSDDCVQEEQRPWLQQDLRVRVVDKSFKNFYKEKVVIIDVPSPGMCVCKSSDGKVLERVSQSSLETVIPRDDSSFVLIVSGSYHGQVGQIMKRDKTQCLALVQLLSDRDTVLKLGFDEVCEYVGDVHARDDY